MSIINNVIGTNIYIDNSNGDKIVDIEIQGNLLQEGTPTPETPQDIHVVSGDNSIEVCGKNLFDESVEKKSAYPTTTIGSVVSYVNSSASSSYVNCCYVEAGTTYTFSCKLNTPASITYRDSAIVDKNNIVLEHFYLWNNSTSHTYTPSHSGYLILCVDNNSTELMIEKNNEATTYEAYKGASYPISLGDIELCKIGDYQDKIDKSSGKNLFDKDSQDILENVRIGADGGNNADSGYFISEFIEVTPNTKYTKNTTADAYHRFAFYTDKSTNSFISKSEDNTITTPSNAKYLRICGLITELDNVMLNEGSTALPCEPYGTGWYLKKEIGKVVLDGSEANWSNQFGIHLFSLPAFLNNNKFIIGYGLSNYYKYNPIQSGINDGTVNGEFVLQISSINYNLFIKNTDYSSVDNFKAWLSTHNTSIYYPLATPTYTEITDSTLISQLNDIDNALLPYGIAHIVVSSDNLPSILSIDYFTQDRYINTSDRYALINNTATIPFKINIIKDGIVIKTLDEYSIINIDYEDFRYVDTSSLVIGQFVARKISGTLDKIYTDFEIEDTELNIQMGVCVNDNTNYYDLGNFLVTKPTNNDVKDKTSFEAMDYTKKFNTPFTDTGLTFPCTALQLAQHTCNLCGVELATTNFDNYDFEIPNNQYTEGDTCRKVMQDIGKLAYSWVRIDWDNKCYIDFDPQDYIVDTNKITNQNYYDLSLQNNVFGPVNRVVVGIKDVEGENAVIEDSDSIAQYGVTEIQLYDSNITYTPELRQQAISKASKLFGLIYTPLESNTTGHPWLIGKEKIQFTTMDGDIKYTYPFDRTIAYNGHIKSKLTSKADTKTETEYRNYGNLETATRQTRIIVDKQNQVIEALAEQVKPISNEISGAGSITLENAYVGTLHRLEITGEISSLLPKDTLLPSNTLYPFEIILDVDGTKYVLGIDYLHYTNSTNHDTYIYEDGRQWIERADGTIEDFGEIFITIDRSSVLMLDNLNTATLKAIYLLENEWTDTFAPTIDLVSKINLAPGLATIAANKIKLEGYTTINENFGVDLQGNMWARNGSFSGNIYLEDGNKILGGDGLYSCLAFTNTGRFSGWDILGYWASGLNVSAGPASYSDSYITAYIPKNFVVDKAYLVLQTSSMYSAYSDASGDYDVVGYPKQLKLFKGDSGTTVSFFYYPYQAVDEYTEYSGTEIQNAFGESAYTPDINYPGAINEKVTIDLSNHVSEGMNTFFVRSTITPRPQIKTYTPSGSSYSAFDYSEVVLNTGIAKLNLYVFGYMSVSEEE